MSSDALLRDTEAFLYENIPITRAMGVRVAAYDAERLVLEAPLSLNHNHLGTAFGGSLNTLATLAGYGVLWMALRDHYCHVVIRDSAITFRRPVRHNLRAVCRVPDQVELSRVKREFTRKGKTRLRLDVTVEDAGQVAVEFTGTFVALREKDTPPVS